MAVQRGQADLAFLLRYYIDVGASELIADGSIKLRSGVRVEALGEHTVLLSDGSELPADVVAYATGSRAEVYHKG
jgi:hypothetical protein